MTALTSKPGRRDEGAVSPRWPDKALAEAAADAAAAAAADAAASAAAAAADAKAERAWAAVPYQNWALLPESAALKRLLRTGCPHSLRPDVWYHVSGGAALANDMGGAAGYAMLSRGGYAALARARGAGAGAGSLGGPLGCDSLCSAAAGDAWAAVREEAAVRALPPHAAEALEAVPGGAAALQRMLVAYAAYNPAPGCLWRGAGPVAALLLGVIRDEARAFWALAALARKLWGYCDGQAQLGVLVETRVMCALVAAKLPRVHEHVVDTLGVPMADLVAPWVSRCFVGALGGTERRLLDCLLYEGPKVLHRAGVALLGLFEAAVESCGHPGALPHVLESRAATTLGAPGGGGLLVGAAFRRTAVGGMAGAKIAALRADAAEQVEAQLERRRRQLAAILGHD